MTTYKNFHKYVNSQIKYRFLDFGNTENREEYLHKFKKFKKINLKKS